MAASDRQRDLEVRLAYLGLGRRDLELLSELQPMIESRADALVSAFYRHLLSFESTRQLLADPAVKDRLLRKQREYLQSLFEPKIGEEYVADRLRIGETHQRIGLEPRWYLGAYSLYFDLLIPLIRDALHTDLDRCERAVGTLVKRLMLDAQLAMEAYIERHEHELSHLNRELAEASRTLTRTLGDRDLELRQTNRRARAAEDLASVATLAAGLAHEIGTPMGVIQGHAEALEPLVSSDEKAQWRLRTIREQVDRISRIIQALLNMARPHEMVREPVALEPLLETTLSFLNVKLKRRGVVVEQDFAATPSVLGDTEKLQQLFLNLGLNAADAMEDGGGTLRVGLKPDGDAVEITFADQGAGIAPELLAKIFDPFFTTKPAGQGNGLGLVVAEGIVHDHGGEIVVESQPGEGTTFRIRLPAARPGRAVR